MYVASGNELIDDERDAIMIGVARSESFREIGLRLGRYHSVISREVRRNGGRDDYRACAAAERAGVMRTRPKERKLEKNTLVHDTVADGLRKEWSSQQIATRLVFDFPDDLVMGVSYETIDETLFVQAGGECATQLGLALRAGRVHRRPWGTSRPKTARITGMVTVSERPGEADDRAVPGHGESDLIIGAKGKSRILMLVERTTRFVVLQKIPDDRTAGRVALLLCTAVKRLPEAMWRSITHDQGVEMAAHARFTIATDILVFFCEPHSPW
ncbi:MAG: IS30 family transposase [Pseudonocardia sp.]